MVIKKGRFGTDPYDIFLNHGTSRTPSVFSLAHWERVRVRDDSIRDVSTSYLGVLRKDAVPYVCSFGHG